MDWNNKRIRLYIEAGLAVLLVLTLALAGASGRLSASADDSGRRAEAVSGQESSTQAEQGSSQEEAEAPSSSQSQETTYEPQEEPSQNTAPAADPTPAPTPVPTPEPTPEPTPQPAASPYDYVGYDIGTFYSLFGYPSSSEYATSCSGQEGDDGILYYGGFTVYTFRSASGSEVVTAVY